MSSEGFVNPFEGDADFQYLALDRKKLMEEAPPFDAKTSCWIVDQKEGYAKANIKATKGDDVTVITESLEVGVFSPANAFQCEVSSEFGQSHA